MTIKTIGFDADDTLWHNEHFFREAENRFISLLGYCCEREVIENALFSTIKSNLSLYGYGFKSFTLSMLETAANLNGNKAMSSSMAKEILALGRKMMEQPVTLIDGVVQVLAKLEKSYRLILISKGDLVEQERKLAKSGLADFFDAKEIVSHKNKTVYEKIFQRYECLPEEFVMVGNSLKSDILPALQAGAWAIYVPYEITWVLEQDDEPEGKNHYYKIDALANLPKCLNTIDKRLSD